MTAHRTRTGKHRIRRLHQRAEKARTKKAAADKAIRERRQRAKRGGEA